MIGDDDERAGADVAQADEADAVDKSGVEADEDPDKGERGVAVGDTTRSPGDGDKGRVEAGGESKEDEGGGGGHQRAGGPMRRKDGEGEMLAFANEKTRGNRETGARMVRRTVAVRLSDSQVVCVAVQKLGNGRKKTSERLDRTWQSGIKYRDILNCSMDLGAVGTNFGADGRDVNLIHSSSGARTTHAGLFSLGEGAARWKVR